MYKIQIKLDDIVANKTIEELEELKEILELFKKVDEFHLEYIERSENDDRITDNNKQKML